MDNYSLEAETLDFLSILSKVDVNDIKRSFRLGEYMAWNKQHPYY